MVRSVLSALVLSVVATGASAAAEKWNFDRPPLVPAPAKASWKSDVCVRMAKDAAKVTLTCPEASLPAATDWFRRHFKAAFGFDCALTATAGASLKTAEAYALAADPAAGVTVAAADLAGVRHAFHTLRQIAIRDRAGVTTDRWILPAFAIEDAPKLAFRGLHLCWFPEQPVWKIERSIRLAAYYKFNVVVLENWGVWRSERHPWFGWKDGPMTPAEVKRLVSIAADEGVTLVPQLNVFGHASLSRVRTGNHATLDVAPEYEPLFEPYSGWNWCLSNPEARRIVKELALELHDLFGRPPYFHIGCDEACPPTCPKCRAADYNALFSSLVREIAETFQARGADVMMWHDMLLKKGDERFGAFYCNGDARAEALLDSLPKGVIVCDWYYGGAQEAYPTLDYFVAKGHRTVTCPAENAEGIAAQGAYACAHGLFGYLGTSWATMYGRNYPEIMLSGAAAAWGVKREPPRLHQDMTSPCNYHLRQVLHDMGVTTRRETGFDDEQMPSKSVTR